MSGSSIFFTVFKPTNYSKLKLINRCFSCSPTYLNSNASSDRKSSLNVCTIGHQGHGKSVLTDALIKVSSKRFNFEPQATLNRNESNASLSQYHGQNYRILHTDCPGDPNFIKNMITNTNSCNVGILVVDGEHGVQDQTREHLLIGSHLGINHYVVFINCKEDIDGELLQLIEMDLIDLFKSRNITLDKDSIIIGNSLAALNQNSEEEIKINNLIDLIEKKGTVAKQDVSELSKKPLVLSIKKVYLKANRGTEVTGVVESGSVRKGDAVEIVGYDRLMRTNIMGIETFKVPVPEAHQGDSVALLLKSVKKDDICRGMVITSACNSNQSETDLRDHIHLSDHLKAELHLLDSQDNPKCKPLPLSNSHMMIFGRTFDIRTLVRVEDSSIDTALQPGSKAQVDLKLLKKMAVNTNQPFVMRDGHHTIAVGQIKQILSALDVNEREGNQKCSARKN